MRSTELPSGRVGLNLELDAPPEHVAALATAFHEMMPSTRSQVECLGCSAVTRVAMTA